MSVTRDAAALRDELIERFYALRERYDEPLKHQVNVSRRRLSVLLRPTWVYRDGDYRETHGVVLVTVVRPTKSNRRPWRAQYSLKKGWDRARLERVVLAGVADALTELDRRNVADALYERIEHYTRTRDAREVQSVLQSNVERIGTDLYDEMTLEQIEMWRQALEESIR